MVVRWGSHRNNLSCRLPLDIRRSARAVANKCQLISSLGGLLCLGCQPSLRAATMAADISPLGAGNRPVRRNRAQRAASEASFSAVSSFASCCPNSPSSPERTCRRPRVPQHSTHPRSSPPQYGPQLVVAVEGEAVVHAVPVPVAHGEMWSPFAVGIFDDDVEHRHPPKRRGVFMYECDNPPLFILAFKDLLPAGGIRRHRSNAVCSGSMSCQSRTMPSPSGPSRSPVRGTMFRSGTSETR